MEKELDVDDVFNYHVWDEDQVTKGILVREALKEAFRSILKNVPDCPDRDVALRKLREARMDANSAITHKGKY